MSTPRIERIRTELALLVKGGSSVGAGDTWRDRCAYLLEVLDPRRRCPVMYARTDRGGPPSISREIAELAHCAYEKRFGRGQALDRLIERGGFGAGELDMFIGPGWRVAESENAALHAEVERLRTELNERVPFSPEDARLVLDSDQDARARLWTALGKHAAKLKG